MFDREIVLDALHKIRSVIDTDVVFRTIQEDIPQMVDTIDKMMADLGQKGDMN